MRPASWAVPVVAAFLLSGCGGQSPPPATASDPAASDPAADARIEREVQARLDAEPSIGSGQVRVEVRDGSVFLHGAVRGIGAWSCALRNASLVADAVDVIDFLVLERGPRETVCLAPAAPAPDPGR